MPEITSENAALAFVKLVSAQFLPALVANLIMAPLVNRNYEATLSNAGDTVNVPIPPTLVANNIAETGTVQTQNPNLGNAQIVLTTHSESSFQIPDVTKILATPSLLQMYMEPAVIAQATSIESALLNTYPEYPTSVGSTSAAINEQTVDAAESAMFGNLVPAVYEKHLVVHHNVYSTLRQISRFTEERMGGDGVAIKTGELVGKFKGFTVHRSQLVPVVSGAYQNLAFVRDGIALTMRRLPDIPPGMGAVSQFIEYAGYGFRIVMSYNPNVLAQQVTVDCLYGVGALRNTFAAQVVSNG